MINKFSEEISNYLKGYRLISNVSKDASNVYVSVCGVRLLTFTIIADKVFHLDSPLPIDESMRHSKSMVYDCDDLDEVISDSKSVLDRFNAIESSLYKLQADNHNIYGDIKSYIIKLGDVTLSYGVDSASIFFFVKYSNTLSLDRETLKLVDTISNCLGVKAELVNSNQGSKCVNMSNSFI